MVEGGDLDRVLVDSDVVEEMVFLREKKLFVLEFLLLVGDIGEEVGLYGNILNGMGCCYVGFWEFG